MHSYGNLWDGFSSYKNIIWAINYATLNKRNDLRFRYIYDNPHMFFRDIHNYINNFHPKKHDPVVIEDGISKKERKIIVPSPKESVVNHMIMNVLRPIFMKSMYEHSYGCVPGRGCHNGKKTIVRWIKDDPAHVKYCLKMDIRKFFDSISHWALMERFEKLIRDKKFLHLIEELLTVYPDGVGLPLGFYSSQWFANYLLQDLDHWIKEQLRAAHYIRYVDDMVIFDSNKRRLHAMREHIDGYLHEMYGLQLKDNWQVFRFDYITGDGKKNPREHHARFLDFMGFRIYRDHVELRQSLMLRIVRCATRLSKKDEWTLSDCQKMLSYLGWIDNTDSYWLFQDWICPSVYVRDLRKGVSAAAPLNETWSDLVMWYNRFYAKENGLRAYGFDYNKYKEECVNKKIKRSFTPEITAMLDPLDAHEWEKWNIPIEEILATEDVNLPKLGLDIGELRKPPQFKVINRHYHPDLGDDANRYIYH